MEHILLNHGAIPPIANDDDGQLLVSRDELLTLRMAVEASGEVIFMTDANGTITYINPEFVRLYGYRPSEVVGRATPRILKGGAATPDEYETFWKRLASNEVVRREFVNRTKSGALVHVESTANPIFTEAGRVGFLAIQRDITARKTTEAALVESERRYRTLAEAAHDSIFIVGRDGRIEYANAVSTARFGVQSQDAIGRTLNEVFPSGTAEEMWREVSVVFTTGQRHSFEARFDTPDGELWLETSVVPMSGDAAEPDAVMGVARDVTDRKRLERQFLQAQKMEAVGQLAGGIAHDFNNVLTAILGYSELLLDRLRDDEELADDVEEIKKAGDRASRLTRQLLAFSRKQVWAPQVLDVNGVLADLHKMLGRIIGEDVRLEITGAPRLDPVKVDPSQIEQVVVNLAVNARDAMPKGGTLTITTRNVELDRAFVQRHAGAVEGKYIAITVQDSGCGMTADVLAHVFEPFFTTKPVGKGTGLGLATVHGIVKQSGGYITIDSAPGAGTAVTTYLPSVNVTPASAQAPAVASPAVPGSETILLVEDEPGVRQLMQRTLERSGYTVLKAATATDAIAIAANHRRPIDLLVSDVVMPDVSGPDVAQRIASLHPAMKVLFVSGFTHQIAIDCRSMSGRAAFLPKPFTPLALTVKVRECLDARL
jgi:PAS domain S-box-containing protein